MVEDFEVTPHRKKAIKEGYRTVVSLQFLLYFAAKCGFQQNLCELSQVLIYKT
jgi:uncharacterized protein YihD (DUF1040 family)